MLLIGKFHITIVHNGWRYELLYSAGAAGEKGKEFGFLKWTADYPKAQKKAARPRWCNIETYKHAGESHRPVNRPGP